MAHSLPFVEWDDRKKRYSVNEKAAAYLSGLDGELGEHPPHFVCSATHLGRPRQAQRLRSSCQHSRRSTSIGFCSKLGTSVVMPRVDRHEGSPAEPNPTSTRPSLAANPA